MEDVEKLEMLAEGDGVLNKELRTAPSMCVCVVPRPPGSDRRVAQPTTTGVRVSYLILRYSLLGMLKVFCKTPIAKDVIRVVVRD
jgi:hypothetical protein